MGVGIHHVRVRRALWTTSSSVPVAASGACSLRRLTPAVGEHVRRAIVVSRRDKRLVDERVLVWVLTERLAHSVAGVWALGGMPHWGIRGGNILTRPFYAQRFLRGLYGRGGQNRRWGGGRADLTVGGGLGLPSESSTRASVRFSSCSSRKARSRRMRWMARRARWMREVRRSLLFSISEMRFLISLHFWR